jgi:hypothetical protein
LIDLVFVGKVSTVIKTNGDLTHVYSVSNAVVISEELISSALVIGETSGDSLCVMKKFYTKEIVMCTVSLRTLLMVQVQACLCVHSANYEDEGGHFTMQSESYLMCSWLLLLQ